MSAAPNLHLVSEDDELAALQREARALRHALQESERQKDFIEGVCQNMTRHIVNLHENFDARLTDFSFKAEQRCQSIEKRLAEVASLADRLAQEQTVRNLRSPEDNESLADQVDAARARE